MPIPVDDSGEERQARMARRVALGLALAALVLLLLARFYPQGLEDVWAAGDDPVESGDLAAVKAPTPARPVAASQARDTATIGPGAGAIQPRDTAPPPPRRRGPRADVVLLPCTTANPRPDGSFVIPPHNPARRTIVGLPSAPGEPRRGFVIPPHDPNHESRVPIEVIPMDSILENTLQVPPHDPNTTNEVRPYAVPCMEDSTAR